MNELNAANIDFNRLSARLRFILYVFDAIL